MPRTTTVNLHYAKTCRPPAVLCFAADNHAGKQAAVRNRVVLKPHIDMARYEFTAVIDWIEVIVSLGRPTQFRHVQRALKRSYPMTCFVEALDPGPGATSARFSIRFQEPRSAALALRSCRMLAASFTCAAEPVLNAIEISVDATPKLPNDDDRAQMMGVMQRTIFTTQKVLESRLSQPRYSISDGDPTFLFPAFRSDEKTQDAWLLAEKVWPVPVDGTFYLGAREDPVLLKLMDKVVDRQNRAAGTLRQLTDTEKRVRVEVTLRRKELDDLGIGCLEDLRDFSFTTMQRRYFQFKLPTFATVSAGESSALAAARRAIEEGRVKRFLATGLIGLIVRRHAEERFRARHLPELKRQLRRDGKKMRRNRRGTGTTGTFVSYLEMNRCVSDALFALTRREQRAWRDPCAS